MQFRLKNHLFPMVVFISLSACATNVSITQDERSPSSERGEVYPSLAESREFDLKFFRSVYQKEGHKNFLMSPTSIRLPEREGASSRSWSVY